MILDYLTLEGYSQAAANFSREANMRAQQENSEIAQRQQILSFIHKGEIESAINALNRMKPQILDSNNSLHFALLRLQLVELIRESINTGSDYKPIIEFAQEQLAPRAATRPKFLTELEDTMVMLFFAPDKMPDAQKQLLSPDLRREVAESVNEAMLGYQTNALRYLVKMRAWAEKSARSTNSDLVPESIDIGLSGGREPDLMDTN